MPISAAVETQSHAAFASLSQVRSRMVLSAFSVLTQQIDLRATSILLFSIQSVYSQQNVVS